MPTSAVPVGAERPEKKIRLECASDDDGAASVATDVTTSEHRGDVAFGPNGSGKSTPVEDYGLP
jgi:hypothetical protein